MNTINEVIFGVVEATSEYERCIYIYMQTYMQCVNSLLASRGGAALFSATRLQFRFVTSHVMLSE